jgi:ADP-sugar diphosphatase
MENSRIALIKSLVRRAETGVSPEYMEMARESRIFTDWAASLDPSFDVQGVTVTAVDFKGRNPSTESVMFVRLAVRTAGVPFDQVVELRGGTVVMLVVLRCEGVDYTVLVSQPRLPTGRVRLKEIPAGMLDNGQFRGKAAQEIEE